MTHPALGRAVPVHFMMATLAGWGQLNPDVPWRMGGARFGLLDGARAVEQMCHGRGSLIRLTLQDHGFDLSAWRSFLLHVPRKGDGTELDGYGYGHSYAHKVVDRIVQAEIDNPERAARVALAESAWPEELARVVEWYREHWKDAAEPDWLRAVKR